MKKIYFLVLAFIVLLFCLLYNNTYEGFTSILNPGESNVASKQPLIDANRDDPQWNKGFKAGYDPEDQNIGKYTALDKMFYMDNLNNQGKNYKKLKKMESTPHKSTKIGTVGNGFLESASKKISNLLKTDEEEKKEEILSEKQQKIQSELRKMLKLEEELNKEVWEKEEKKRLKEEIEKTKENIKKLTIETLELNENIDIKNISNQVLQSEIDLLLTTESDEQEKFRLQKIIKEKNTSTFEKLTAEKEEEEEKQELLKKKSQDELDSKTIICNSKNYTGYSGDCFDKCFKKYESEMTDKQIKMCYTKFSENDKIDGNVYLHSDYTVYWNSNGNPLKIKDLDLDTLNSCANDLHNDKTGFYLDDENGCTEVEWETIDEAQNEGALNNFLFFKPVDCVGSHKPDDCPTNTGIQKFKISIPKRHLGKDCANDIGDEFDCGKDQRTDCSTTDWNNPGPITPNYKDGGWWRRWTKTVYEPKYGGEKCTSEQTSGTRDDQANTPDSYTSMYFDWQTYNVDEGYYVKEDGSELIECKEGDKFFCSGGRGPVDVASALDLAGNPCIGDKVAYKNKATSEDDCKIYCNLGNFWDGSSCKKCPMGFYCEGGYEDDTLKGAMKTPCTDEGSPNPIPMTSPEGSNSYDACKEIQCAAGEYWDSYCKQCPKDTYCPAGPSGTRPASTAPPYETCEDGKTTGGKTGMTLQSDCKPTCEAGEYWDSTTNTCETCRKKKYCEGGWGDDAKEEECGTIDGVDKYETRIEGEKSSSDCKKYCGPGKFLSDNSILGKCDPCTSFKPAEGNIYYCEGGWGKDESEPKRCPDNTIILSGVDASGEVACLPKCDPGTYWNGTSCSSECKVDHYCEGGVQTEALATSCGTGKTTYGEKTATSSNDCLDLCEAGKYFHSSSKTCRFCPAGYYCEGGKHNSQCPENARELTPAGGEPQKKLSDCKVKPGWTWDGTVSTVPVMCLENHYCGGGKPSGGGGGQNACPSGKTVAAGAVAMSDCKEVCPLPLSETGTCPENCPDDKPILDSVTNECRARGVTTITTPANCVGRSFCPYYKTSSGTCPSWIARYGCRTQAGSTRTREEKIVGIDPNENQYTADGTGARWIKLYEGTMTKPEIVTSFSMTGKMRDQGWGNRSYGEIMAVGSYQGKRSWQKHMYASEPYSPRGTSWRPYTGWFTESTSGEVDYSKSPDTETTCASRGWPRYTMPAGEGGTTRCGGVPEQGKTDRIELWSHSRRSSGHKGYAKDVTFEVNP